MALARANLRNSIIDPGWLIEAPFIAIEHRHLAPVFGAEAHSPKEAKEIVDAAADRSSKIPYAHPTAAIHRNRLFEAVVPQRCNVAQVSDDASGRPLSPTARQIIVLPSDAGVSPH